MSRFKSEATWRVLLQILALCSGAILLLILGFLAWETLPILHTIFLDQFWRDPGWYPSEQAYNLTPMVMGTLGVTVGAVLVATPLGLLSAVFCQYYAPTGVAQLYRRLIELLAGIPSVVYGLWGLVVLVPLIAKVQPPGSSLLAGTLILALMILPTIALVTDASLASLPPSYWHGSAALGLGTWATVQGICLPAIRSGLLTAVMLATARALGETMAVLMVCGNVVQVPDSIFAPVRTLTANIALEMAYALDLHRSALFASGLVLMLVVTGLVVVTDRMTDAPES
ncbi:phosphate ABC transporter permease subunit PstC [Acaryochloris sp. IP29b_bin.137]|uniref:phosphate ABC transporter permease subunit PstC n=1 Tax=Acaryochloris sp. IP29b_bin.137 TaxID=2969217 RepID=UPI0026109324|nr:phosphate ABC transporter permease subunit PstC [Acaryochloris sp. IP29b_bin.137]